MRLGEPPQLRAACLAASAPCLAAAAVEPERAREHAERDQRVRDVGVDVHVADDRFPRLADGSADGDEHGIPDERADRRQQQEQREAHAGHARRDRDEAAHERHEPAEQHGPRAVAVEPGVGLADVLGLEAQDVAPARDDPLQALRVQPRADVVQDDGTDDRAERRGDDDADDGHARAGGHEAAEGQDDLGRNRREQIFNRDQESNAEVAEAIHDLRYPGFHKTILSKGVRRRT